MAKHQDLCLQRGSRSEKSDQPAPDHPAEVAHPVEDSADSLPQANRIRFATGTGFQTKHPASFGRLGICRQKARRDLTETVKGRFEALDNLGCDFFAWSLVNSLVDR
jgi:hypothetical protein